MVNPNDLTPGVQLNWSIPGQCRRLRVTYLKPTTIAGRIYVSDENGRRRVVNVRNCTLVLRSHPRPGAA